MAEGKLSRTTRPAARAGSDEEIRALLDLYRCSLPFHAVRTRFLGNIASPALSVAPLETVKALWGSELPEFDSVDAVNELMAARITGLWNRLTRHQQRGAPFRLMRVDIAATREGLARIALIRTEELEGFIDGLFGKEESIDLPERAHRAVTVLSQIRAMWKNMRDLAEDPTRPAATDDITGILGHARELTKISEHEIHEAVLSCTRARRQTLRSMPATKPTIH